ncbi:hypothetical protein F0U59_22900 [Archangium gephyra]|nr:hypothetical protein F0U59_22900 [Archangium gephyra]
MMDNNQVALPVEVYSAEGHKLQLMYTPFGNSHTRLASIADASGQTVLQVTRDTSGVEILFNPAPTRAALPWRVTS